MALEPGFVMHFTWTKLREITRKCLKPIVPHPSPLPQCTVTEVTALLLPQRQPGRAVVRREALPRGVDAGYTRV